ncbi:MAG: sugar transferase [Acidimicrobiia bacterium]|nr:sugar transferase [Acidimicrobiia bacterium]
MARVTRRYLFLKRILDLVLLLIALPFVATACLVIAVLVRIDSPGPIVFKQNRTGQFGRRFEIYKFRTMLANAEELKAQLAHLNVLDPPDFKIPDDPRITRVGRFLRKTSLDELPQLLNVAKGDMSLVGPRPTSFSASTYDVWHGRRLEVPPGVTGLWQLGARHDSGFDERVRIDDEYIHTMSLRTDLSILWRTVASVVTARGA